jgi:hypothetical protein
MFEKIPRPARATGTPLHKPGPLPYLFRHRWFALVDDNFPLRHRLHERHELAFGQLRVLRQVFVRDHAVHEAFGGPRQEVLRLRQGFPVMDLFSGGRIQGR